MTSPSSPSKDDNEFYEELLREMRTRRAEETQRRKWKLPDAHSSLTKTSTSSRTETDMTESSSHSFLSWASASLNTTNGANSAANLSLNLTMEELEHSFHEENSFSKIYWKDRAQGRVNPNTSRLSNEGTFDLFTLWKPPKPTSRTPQGGGTSTGTIKQLQVLPGGSANQEEMLESFQALQYSREDIQFLAFGGHNDFKKLQRSLRKRGAVTNEVLKQVLPMVVAQSQERRIAKEQQRKQQMESILEMEPDDQARKQAQAQAQEQPPVQTRNDTAKRGRANGKKYTKSNRAKPPIHQAFSFLLEEKKEEQRQ